MKICLLGDYDATVTAHQAIPEALRLAAADLALSVEPLWLGSSTVGHADLEDLDALWCVPASPYANPAAVIDAIRYARENELPFLGTCGGYQHAVLEFARNRLGQDRAESTEENPASPMPLICALRCRLADASDAIILQAGTRAASIYESLRIVEEFNCGFGVNPDYLPLFAESELVFSGFDDHGDPRIAEIAGHPFFIATAFQPERSAFGGRAHPLVKALLRAAA